MGSAAGQASWWSSGPAIAGTVRPTRTHKAKKKLQFGTANMGGTRASATLVSDLRANLTTSPAFLMAFQEIETDQLNELAASDWRTVQGPFGLAIAGQKNVVAELKWLAEGQVEKAKGVSRWLIARATFRVSAAGLETIVVASAHIHNDAAKKRGQCDDVVKGLARDLADHQVRLLGVDANMALYYLGPAMVGHKVGATLAASHVEFERTSYGLLNHALYDSLGIFVIGPCLGVQRKVPSAHAIAGAMHPLLHDGKSWQRGFSGSSFVGLPAPAHAELNSALQGRCATLIKNARKASTPLGPVTCHTQRECILARHKYANGYVDEPVITGSTSDAWDVLPEAYEKIAGAADMDPNGAFWGRGGHFSLFVVLGRRNVRDTTRLWKAKKRVREHKKHYFKQYGVWPWWIEHPSEALFHVPIAEGGFGYKGVLWRLVRDLYTDAESAEYDEPWVRAYGQEALDKALKHTERWFQEAKKRGLTNRDIWEHREEWFDLV